MEINQAFEMVAKYYGQGVTIRVDQKGFINLNDMQVPFIGKDIKEWRKNLSTKEMIILVQEEIGGIPPITTFKGQGKNKGTWAHHLLAFKFAMWLSPEFELEVIKSYIAGTQLKKDWNIKRILAARNARIMTDAIKETLDPQNGGPYMKEHMMLNKIVFGRHETGIRDRAPEWHLDVLAELEAINGALISYGLSFEQREEHLKKRGAEIWNRRIEKETEKTIEDMNKYFGYNPSLDSPAEN